MPGVLQKQHRRGNVLLSPAIGNAAFRVIGFAMKSVLKTLLSGLLASTALAAPFAGPTEAITPFHRATLPIDTDSMSGLSGQLTMLARGASLESPPLRRAWLLP